MNLTTGELAKIMGITKETLFHYDEIGLFRPAIVLPNRYRYYEITQTELLNTILLHYVFASFCLLTWVLGHKCLLPLNFSQCPACALYCNKWMFCPFFHKITKLSDFVFICREIITGRGWTDYNALRPTCTLACAAVPISTAVFLPDESIVCNSTVSTVFLSAILSILLVALISSCSFLLV